MFVQILDEIKKYDCIILHRHGRPDGDAIGSQVGMKYILTENFPEKQIFMVGDNPGFYGFIEGSRMDDIPDCGYNGALAIILDCGSKSMVNDDRYTLAAKTIRFDHHIFCEKIADLEVVDTSFESCCGLVTEFAVQCGLTLNLLASKALFTGMITDSGRFRYDSTNSRTFRLASKLMEQNIDTNELYRTLYADDFSSKLLKAKFILKIRFTANNVAYIYTTLEEMQELQADTFTVSRGMVGTMSDTKGVDIWVNFTETEKGVLCEIRSGKYNINPIAIKYGGGGHAKASGATVADKETAMAMLADLDAMIGENK